ncbi:ribosome maturation factor RimM [Neomegalonema perideroedes]|uniref:ribosome maturation factor RimM n=1 Tax=Neomegalonema perideroedes TaxID=217219 RepID=UPI00035D921D|nr:ribosome maturation factor RimM [Neomegalonema perideroedes]
MSEASDKDKKDERVCVGAVAGAFGVRGEARLKPFTEDPRAVASYGPVETEDGARSFTLKISRPIGDGLAVWLSGVKTREEAEALKGTRLYVSREALPEPEEDEFYHADLIGLKVEDLKGEPLGVVRSVQNYGAGDFLEIVTPGRKAPALMPFTRETAPKIDLKGGRLVADPPEGVFGEEAPPQKDPEAP